MNRAGAVVIIGGGITGIVAALELLVAGREVILLDRDTADNFGGLARESFGGIFAVDTPIQRRHGISDSVDRAFADWLRFGELSAADGWAYRWAEAFVNDCRRDVFEWLRARGIAFLPMPQWAERSGNSVPRWHIVWGTGRHLATRLIECLREAEGKSGLTLLFSRRVERLLVEDGRVVGCAGVYEAGGSDALPAGTSFEIRGDAVLIASGGINGSLDQVRAHWPREAGPPPAELLNGAHRFADGLLHGAVAELGGRLTHLDRMWNYAAGVRHWRPRKPAHGLSLVPPRGALWLDAGGTRYAPPLLTGLDTSAQVARIAAGGGTSWQLLNHRIAVRELAVSGAEFNPSIRERRPLAFARDLLFGNRRLVAELVANCPDIVVAGSLAELVERMNRLGGGHVQLSAVERAVCEYDAAIASGAPFDDEQLRNIESARRWRGDRLRTCALQQILDPRAGPLLAIHERLISRKSLGGIATDLSGRVLDSVGRPLPGLYAAGETTGFGGGGMHGRRSLEGTFLAGCIYSARRAAQALTGASGIDER